MCNFFVQDIAAEWIRPTRNALFLGNILAARILRGIMRKKLDGYFAQRVQQYCRKRFLIYYTQYSQDAAKIFRRRFGSHLVPLSTLKAYVMLGFSLGAKKGRTVVFAKVLDLLQRCNYGRHRLQPQQ